MDQKQLGKTLKKALSYVVVAALASLGTWVAADKIPNSKLEELSSVIDRKFVGEADQTAIQDAAAEAMVGALGDRWSYYIPASQQAYYAERRNNTYVGVGITVMQREDGSGYDVVSVVSGGPAEEVGILAGDIITHADGEEIGQLNVSQVQERIVGEKNTKVKLTVLRGGESLEFTVTRRKIQTKSAEGQMLDNKTGYVRIENFYENAADDTIEAVEVLLEEGAEQLIFDLRDNPGGYVHELEKMLDYLLPEGPIFRSVDYKGKETVEQSDADCLELPMAVLFNGNTYSAAEFFAAALREYDWAITVGEPTTGKGYYQTSHVFSDGSSVNLSTGQYTTPNGVSLAAVGGLKPDVEVKLTESVTAWQEDPQIRAAMEALEESK